MLMIKYMILILTILTTMMMLLLIISKKSIITLQKSSPFECGFEPMSNKRMPFSIHFFLIAIIFLIFDVEVIIILPMTMTMKFSLIKYWSMTIMLFITMLAMGLYYEWYNGLLNWTK